MAEWKYACKTTQGMDLDLKLLSRGMDLKLTKSMSGAGRTSPTQLMLLQDVMDPVQELKVLDAVERLEEDVIRIPVTLKNSGVKEGYDMHQLGIYAEDPDAGEILYIVLQSDSAEEIPSAEEMKDFTLEWYLNLSVGNAQEVTVMIDETDVLTTEEADAKYVAKDAASDTEVTFEASTDRDNINSGDTLSTLFGKIKKWLADLKQVAFTGSYNDLSNKPTIPAAVRVKGDAETTYHTGDVNITPANIGLGNVDNTADSAKNVNAAIMLKGWADTRNVATTPNDYNSTFKCVGIKTPSACGLSDGSTYYTLFGVRGYGDSTGGQALEIAVSGNNGKLYFRMGATTTWGSWKTFADLTSTVSSANTLANARTIFGRNFNGSGNVAGQGLFYGTYMAAASSRYNNSGLQIRENGQVGNSQSDIAYAPAIGFHWQGKMAGTFAMDSTGTFRLFKQDGVTPANLEATVTKATSAVKADSATRTENEFISAGKQLTLQSSGIWYRLGHFAYAGSAHAEFKVYSSQGSGISICYKFVIGGTCHLKEGWEIEKLYNSKDGSSSFTLDAVRVIAMEETNSSNIYVEVRMRDTGAISGLNTWWYEMEQPKCIQKTWVDDAFEINASIPSVSYKSHITYL